MSGVRTEATELEKPVAQFLTAPSAARPTEVAIMLALLAKIVELAPLDNPCAYKLTIERDDGKPVVARLRPPGWKP